MDDHDEKPPKSETQDETQAQEKAQVAEREPLSVVVLDAPVAEPAVLPETRAEVPVDTQQAVEEPAGPRRIPYWYWALVGLGVFLMMLSFRRFYSPLLVHVEDSIERRIMGDKIHKAPEANPHTPRQKGPRLF